MAAELSSTAKPGPGVSYPTPGVSGGYTPAPWGPGMSTNQGTAIYTGTGYAPGTGTPIISGTGTGSTGTTPAGPGPVVSSVTEYVSPTQTYYGVLPGQYIQRKTETYGLGKEGWTQTREYYWDPEKKTYRHMPGSGPSAAPGSRTEFKSVSSDLFESTYSPMPQGQTTMEPTIPEPKITETKLAGTVSPSTTAYDTRDTFFEPKFGFYASPEWKSMKGGAQHVSQTIAENWETMPYEEKLARTGIQFGVGWIVGGPLLSGSTMFSQVARVGIQQTGNVMVAKSVAEKGPIEILQPENILWTAASTVSPIAKTSPLHYGETPGWKGLYTYGERPVIGKTPEGIAVGMPKPEITASAIAELQSAKPSKGYTPTTAVETKMVARPEVFEKLGLSKAEFEVEQAGARILDYTKNIEVPGKVLSDAKFTRDIGSMGPAGVEASLATSKANIKDVEMHYGSHMAEAQLTPEFKAQIGKPGDMDKMLKPTTAEGAGIFAGKELAGIRAAGETARISPKSPTLVEVKGAAGTKDWVHAVDIHYPGEPSLEVGSVPGKGSWGIPYGKPPIKVEGIPGMKLSEQVHKKLGDTSMGIMPRGEKVIGPPTHRMKDVPQGLLGAKQLKVYRESTWGSKLDPRERGKSRQFDKDIAIVEKYFHIDGGKQGPFEDIPYIAPVKGRGEPSLTAFPSMGSFRQPSSSSYLPSKSSYLPSGPNYLPSGPSYLPSRSSMPSRAARSPSIFPSARPSISLGPSMYPSSRPPSKPPSGYKTYSPKASASPYPSLVPKSLSPSPSLGRGSMIAGRKRLRLDFGLPSFGKEKGIFGGYGLKMTPRYSPTATAFYFDIHGKQPGTITGYEMARPITGKTKGRRKKSKGLFNFKDSDLL